VAWGESRSSLVDLALLLGEEGSVEGVMDNRIPGADSMFEEIVSLEHRRAAGEYALDNGQTARPTPSNVRFLKEMGALEEAYSGTVYRDGKNTYVDTAFINNVTGMIPGFVVKHMGFGEFSLEGPDSSIEFDRMRGKDFPGQSGRSHLIYMRRGGDKKIISKLVAKMVKKGKAKIVKATKVPTPKDVAKKTGMRVAGKPKGQIQKDIYAFFQKGVLSSGGRNPWLDANDAMRLKSNRPVEFGQVIRSLEAMTKSGILDKKPGTAPGPMGKNPRYRLAEETQITEAKLKGSMKELLKDLGTRVFEFDHAKLLKSGIIAVRRDSRTPEWAYFKLDLSKGTVSRVTKQGGIQKTVKVRSMDFMGIVPAMAGLTKWAIEGDWEMSGKPGPPFKSKYESLDEGMTKGLSMKELFHFLGTRVYEVDHAKLLKGGIIALRRNHPRKEWAYFKLNPDARKVAKVTKQGKVETTYNVKGAFNTMSIIAAMMNAVKWENDSSWEISGRPSPPFKSQYESLDEAKGYPGWKRKETKWGIEYTKGPFVISASSGGVGGGRWDVYKGSKKLGTAPSVEAAINALQRRVESLDEARV